MGLVPRFGVVDEIGAQSRVLEFGLGASAGI